MIKAKYMLVGSCITNYIKNVFKNTIKIKFRNTRKKKKKFLNRDKECSVCLTSLFQPDLLCRLPQFSRPSCIGYTIVMRDSIHLILLISSLSAKGLISESVYFMFCKVHRLFILDYLWMMLWKIDNAYIKELTQIDIAYI